MPIQIIEDKKESNYCNQYLAECSFCHSKITYLGLDISFHRNYPNGYVYCPKCRRPIAHVEDNLFKGGKSPDEIKAMVVDAYKKQRIGLKKSKNGAYMISSVFSIASIIAIVFGAIGMRKDGLYAILLFLGFLLFAFAIVFLAAIGGPSQRKIERIDKVLSELEK